MIGHSRKILFLFTFLTLLYKHIALSYQVVESNYDGPEIVGACGRPIPHEKSRLARNMNLLCGSVNIEFDRKPIKSPYWDKWSQIERSDSSGSLETRNDMQKIRLEEEPIKWVGQSTIPTYEAWVWSVRMRGKNPQYCRVWTRNYSCQKTRPIPITKRVCTETDEETSSPYGSSSPNPARSSDNSRGFNSGRGSNRGSRDDNNQLGGRSGKPRSDSPSTGNLNSGRVNESYKDFKNRSEDGSRKSGSGNGGKKKESNRRSWIPEFSLFPKAVAEQCETRTIGYRDEVYTDTCSEQVVDECEWEEEQFELKSCSNEQLNYSVEFAKPDVNWKPGQKGYHDLLPNKYDLLPGEWEVIHLLVNHKAKEQTYGSRAQQIHSGISHSIKPSVIVESKDHPQEGWNKYSLQFENSDMVCSLNTPINIKATINTEERIIRKAPNALAPSMDRLGRDESLRMGEKFLGGDQKVKLRPYKIQLVDNSNDVMLTAARQSRKFTDDLDPETVSAVHNSDHASLTAQDLGFWKNTLLKVKLIEKGDCFGEPDKMFADVLDTTSRLTKAEDSKLVVQLDGEQSGVPSFYQPFGFVGRFLRFFSDKTIDLYPTPGRNYEFHISMLQQGLPFYENGCLDGKKTCEQQDANPSMYSDDLIISFHAEENYDERGWLQTFENWYGRKLWNKFRKCHSN